MAKHIFVIGGVLSSIGKGITSASIGFLFKRMGYSVAMQKLDPYLNVDPGRMSPFQHGEVFVTEDGGEIDLDLGHYERFIGQYTSKDSSATSGVIYERVINKERNGEYHGKTVQVIPHVTNEIKLMLKKVIKNNDVVITEIGGTVGDIESLPFLEAIRQYRLDIGYDNTFYILLTYLPYMKTAGELKTKPTQHAAIKLREIGVLPDLILCRTEMNFDDEVFDKIALYTNVDRNHVKLAIDTESVYEIPKNYYIEGIHELICNHFGLEIKPVDFSVWDEFLHQVKHAKNEINIIVCGKYVEHQDAYKSLEEALIHGSAWNKAKVIIRYVDSEKKLSDKECQEYFKNIDGIVVPGGIGLRSIDTIMQMICFAREKNIPFLGICLGMQAAVVEFAQNVCKIENAHSTEFDDNCKNPIIDLMLEQKYINSMNGTFRLGAFPCKLKPDSQMAKIYEMENISERHRHKYEFNNKYRELIEEKGMHITGTSPNDLLVEIVEIPTHPFFIGVQFHPEFKSSPDRPHKIFMAFIEACKKVKSLRVKN